MQKTRVASFVQSKLRKHWEVSPHVHPLWSVTIRCISGLPFLKRNWVNASTRASLLACAVGWSPRRADCTPQDSPGNAWKVSGSSTAPSHNFYKIKLQKRKCSATSKPSAINTPNVKWSGSNATTTFTGSNRQTPKKFLRSLKDFFNEVTDPRVRGPELLSRYASHLNQIKCLFKNARPDPDFKYFSNSKALYLSVNIVCVISLTGRRLFVAGTYPLLCLCNLSSISSVQPVYNFPSAHLRI